MSAIWGTINFNNQSFNNSFVSDIEKDYQSYKIDRFDKVSLDNAVFGCCHQYLTKEASDELLPLHDKERNILFTADCVLDNRSELLTHFPELSPKATDSQILYTAYLKWGKALGEYVLGAFTFAAYHYSLGYVTLWTDHMCCRSLFYTFQKGVLYFSTLLAPLARATHALPCEKWLAGCLATVSADMMIYQDLSPFQDVLQINAAHMLTINEEGVRAYEYWSPLKLRPTLRPKNTKEAKQLFLDTFTGAISSMLRSPQNTGCTLSSGLDSSSIACLTASLFQAENKTLYSYTSVPLSGFSADKSSTKIANETPGVQKICRMYQNIQPHFVSCEKKDAFSELSRLVPLLGYPMKSGYNLTWLDEIYQQASANNCKLMLKGQFGNSTISYGPALGVIYQKLCSLKPLAAYRIMKGFSKQYHVPRKKIIQFMLQEYREQLLVPFPEDMITLTKPELWEKYNIKSTLKNLIRSSGGGQMDSRKQRLSFLFNPYALTQLGMFDTAMGLLYGLLIRDPTKDKRIVEFCARLPVEYNLAGYLERGMVRSFMRGIVPDEILLDVYHRGVQSADYAYRSRLLWEEQRDGVLAALTNPKLALYADPAMIASTIDFMQTTDVSDITQQDFIKTNVLYSCSQFMNAFD